MVPEGTNSTAKPLTHRENDIVLLRGGNISTKNENVSNSLHLVSRKEINASGLSARIKAQKGVLTRDIYDAGHIIPNAELCPDLGQGMKLMLLITSSPEHSEPRMAIRQTWGHFSQRKDISVAFVVGLARTNPMNDAIRMETEMYGDIIQSRIADSYDNLTLKTVSMFEWVDSYCSQVRDVKVLMSHICIVTAKGISS